MGAIVFQEASWSLKDNQKWEPIAYPFGLQISKDTSFLTYDISFEEYCTIFQTGRGCSQWWYCRQRHEFCKHGWLQFNPSRRIVPGPFHRRSHQTAAQWGISGSRCYFVVATFSSTPYLIFFAHGARCSQPRWGQNSGGNAPLGDCWVAGTFFTRYQHSNSAVFKTEGGFMLT